nr:hypothetical protein [Moorena producens]
MKVTGYRLSSQPTLHRTPKANNLQPSTKQPSTKQPSTKQPSTKQPSTKQPSTKQPSTKQPSNKQPSTKQPSTKQPWPLATRFAAKRDEVHRVQPSTFNLGLWPRASQQSGTKSIAFNLQNDPNKEPPELCPGGVWCEE